MRSIPRKRRTPEHVLADLSINHVERHVLRCAWSVERIIHDYGLDLHLFTFDKHGNAHEGIIFMQVKATRRLRLRRGAKTFPFRIERRDLVYWLSEVMPVILVVYDGGRDRAYWLYVQSHFRKQERFNLFAAKATLTVRIPTRNVLSPQAIRKFAHFRDRIVAQTAEVVHDEDA